MQEYIIDENGNEIRTTLMVLEAPEGTAYTQKKEVPISQRILASKIYLASNDNADNWELLTPVKYQEYLYQIEDWEKEQKESAEKELETPGA